MKIPVCFTLLTGKSRSGHNPGLELRELGTGETEVNSSDAHFSLGAGGKANYLQPN